MSWTNLLMGGASVAIPTDPTFASVQLLLHGEGTNGSATFVDNSPSPKSMSSSGATISTAQFKFGAASISVPVNGDYVNANFAGPYTPWQFGAGKFTVESWVRFTSAPGSNVQGIVTQFGGSSNLGWFFGMVSGSLAFYYSTTGTDNPNVGAAWTPNLNQWYFLAVDRDASNVLRIYIDGVVFTSATVSATFFASTLALWVGSDASGRSHIGFLDEVRITKGVARYGGAFTPPTAAFPNS